MNTYIFRAECLHDAVNAINRIKPLSYSFSSPLSLGVNVKIMSDMDIDYLFDDLAHIPDSHVMVRTLLQVEERDGKYFATMNRRQFDTELEYCLDIVRNLPHNTFLCTASGVLVTVTIIK